MDDVAVLIETAPAQDAIGQWDGSERRRTVYVSIGGVNRAEHFKAAEAGLSPAAVLTTSLLDYGGEELLEWRGKQYAIYRTHADPERETVELYIERQGGIHGRQKADQDGWIL